MAPKERSARNTNLQRMDKSITVLSVKFCAILREANDAVNIVQAAKTLGTQKRRLHEILNIIQSVGLVSKVGIGLCKWLGEESMLEALQELKQQVPNPTQMSKLHKKAVATALSERFLQVFLHQDVQVPVILEDIMNIVTSDMTPLRDENPVSPTRRIYDIANVLCSLNLIKKILIVKPDTKRKQITFIWCGPIIAGKKFPRIQPILPLKRGADEVQTSNDIKRVRSSSECTSVGDGSPRPYYMAHPPLPPLSAPKSMDFSASPLCLILRNDQLTKELAEAKAREDALKGRIAKLEAQLDKYQTETCKYNMPGLRHRTVKPLPFQSDLDMYEPKDKSLTPSQKSLMAASTLLTFTPNQVYTTNSYEFLQEIQGGGNSLPHNVERTPKGKENRFNFESPLFEGLSPLTRLSDECNFA
ncbi:hypothetical protein THRCLA_22056 [Thraustotheca clavata]|uniref:E2F/DP family winged-helix DNA-binding domain-containing protein n=1 Tax=Thraustotheca clavata TaxID=74557 RepID=A0A1V9ZD39_9STRA|nr:hypothetical protein THRCLA_22056 [Thraustotheca clavata]